MVLLLSAVLLPFAWAGEPSSVEEGNTAFAVKLYREVAKAEGNVALSPFSVSTALAMTWAGARGETAEEMRSVLGFGSEQQAVHEAFAELQAKLAKASEADGVELNIANRLWGMTGHVFEAEFLRITREGYGAELEALDFSDAAKAAKTINTWIEAQTKDRIKDLLAAGDLGPLTRLVLTNAVYFKGSWLVEFDPKATQEASFFAPTGEVEVKMMFRKGEMRYGETDDAQLVSLPYRGEGISMLLVLPKAKDGLGALEAKLDAELLSKWMGLGAKEKVKLWLPRFRLESTFSLGEALQALGMPSAFSEASADFSGMTGRRGLYISAVLHKVFVEVNEEGTEAAAATAVVMKTRRAVESPPTPEFRADHPFLFLLCDDETGSILFMGRVQQPD
jgi:serpin B